MTSSVTLLAAFGGGLVSFLSPCVLPIVPADLSIITGLEIGEIREGRGPLGRIARDTGLFIAGFSTVFVLGTHWSSSSRSARRSPPIPSRSWRAAMSPSSSTNGP